MKTALELAQEIYEILKENGMENVNYDWNVERSSGTCFYDANKTVEEVTITYTKTTYIN